MTTRRDFLFGTIALPAGGGLARGVRRKGTRLISPSYGYFPHEWGEMEAAFSLVDHLLTEEDRASVYLEDAAGKGISALADVIDRKSEAPDPALHNYGREAGPTLVEPARAHPRMVVFSDHHLGPAAHRHNVFSGVGGRHFRYSNHGLYEAVLERYLDRDYTLVENGDVEDLVVFDPLAHPGEYQRRVDAWLDVGLDPVARVDRMKADRRKFRTLLLAEILADPVNARYYALLDQYAKRGKLFRLAGNHDHDRVQIWDEAVKLAREIRPDAQLPDGQFGAILVLRRDGAWETVMLHGHQFDHSSSPLHAAKHGETISECMGIWYQGADRIWPWEEWGAQWAAGRPFVNRLVSGRPTDKRTLREHSAGNNPYSYPEWEEALSRRWAFPSGPKLFESMFQHPVAWEYLERADDTGRSGFMGGLRALAAGEAWFKYRHTEELALATGLPDLLATRRPPDVILGHTHEPRAGAIDALGVPVDWYFNSAATGRFEGIVWAVEVMDGEAQVVSWHPASFPVGEPTRRVWSPGGKYREVLVSREERLS
jgi:hypothetical protein